MKKQELVTFLMWVNECYGMDEREKAEKTVNEYINNPPLKNNEHSKRELLIAFFIHFRDNGEKNIGMSIEKFIDNYLEDYVL